ncbi:MAG: proprotein convertase P-domain-containing protein [Chitinophagales bacterium]|nr:proprotein convertase P-domain-containing protein [Chitinophagales bacterium]MDW8419925.1 proprotein convertase P-domain-containing protein [Chitinophagales bacterium]
MNGRYWLLAVMYGVCLKIYGQAEIQNTSKPWWGTIGNAGTNPVNNFIGTTDAQDFAVRTQNTERIRVLAAGNVGIGIATPTERLHVSGNLRIDNAFMPGNQPGTAGQVLTSTGPGTAPVWKSFPSYALTDNDNVPQNLLGPCNLSTPAGTFSNNTAQSIPDVSTINVPITVSGITGNVCKVTITININHTWDADLDIFLIGPGGQVCELTTDNGGSGDNYSNTTFDDAAPTSITTGIAPFTGTFLPETPLSVFNNVNPNGTWTLQITDDLAGDVGTFLSATIRIFTNTPGSFTYVGEVPVQVFANETVIIQANYSNRLNGPHGVAVRISRDAASGSGTVGTVLGYCADSAPAGSYCACGVSERDAGLTPGTYYYKLWEFASSPVPGTRNYSLVIHKETN